MTARRMLMAVLIACCGAGVAWAQPEPTPKVTKGDIVGKITAKDGGKITVKGDDGGVLTLIPHWRGGLPKDGGGFDQKMMSRLEAFRVGDKVKVTWVFDEHYRIEKIELLARPRPK